MRRFRFSLQSLLTCAEKRQDAAQCETAREQGRVYRHQARLEALHATLESADEGARRGIAPCPAQPGPDSDPGRTALLEAPPLARLPIAWRALHQYIRRIERQIVRQNKALAAARVRLAQARERLTEASRERKKFERLRDRQYDEYLREMKTTEQKILDDITMSRVARAGTATASQVDE